MPFLFATSFGADIKFRHFAKQTPNKQRNAYKGAVAFAASRKAALTLFEMGRGVSRNGSTWAGKLRSRGTAPSLLDCVARSKELRRSTPAY
jgi:hypothetical protein